MNPTDIAGNPEDEEEENHCLFSLLSDFSNEDLYCSSGLKQKQKQKNTISMFFCALLKLMKV